MNARFLLKAAQSKYLKNLSEPTVAFAASATAQAVEHRLPVILHKGKKPPRDENRPAGLAPEKEIFKILEVKNKLNITEGEEGPEPGGEVIIDIDYITP